MSSDVFAGYLSASEVGERIRIEGITDERTTILHAVIHDEGHQAVRLILDCKTQGGRRPCDVDPRTIVTIL